MAISLLSCKKDSEVMPVLKTASFDYSLNLGQLDESYIYMGSHPYDLSAKLLLEEQEDGKTKVTVTLNNTKDGQTYNIHAHDAMDPNTTPNGTPYNESPNANVFIGSIVGNGGTASTSQMSDMSVSNLQETYKGFLVVHDPLQAVDTKNPQSFLIVGSFARVQTATINTMSFDYGFNTGQVATAYAYNGTHANNLIGNLLLVEQTSGKTQVIITLKNTISGASYPIHSHDAADPNTTPNSTPYDEAPNSGVLVSSIIGDGGSVSTAHLSTMSMTALSSTYNGFLVVHDPLQAMSTTDPKTFLLLGSFAR